MDVLRWQLTTRRQLQGITSSLATSREFSPPVRRIVARSGSEYLLLSTDEVLAFQAEGDVVWILTFKRIHREALVNINHIRKMSPLTSQRWL